MASLDLSGVAVAPARAVAATASSLPPDGYRRRYPLHRPGPHLTRIRNAAGNKGGGTMGAGSGHDFALARTIHVSARLRS
jgi:hypothetical protein